MNTKIYLKLTILLMLFHVSCKQEVKEEKVVESEFVESNEEMEQEKMLLEETIEKFNQEEQTLDLTIRNQKTQTKIHCSMVAIDSDSIILKGFVSDFKGLNEMPVTLVLPKKEIKKIELEKINQSIIFSANKETNLKEKNSDRKLSYSISEFKSNEAIHNKYRTYSGIYIDDTDNEYEFFVNTDPVPIVVALAAIVAGGCIVKIVFDKLSLNCKEIIESEACIKTVADCSKNGMEAEIGTESIFILGYDSGLKVGCNMECKCKCKEKKK